MYSMKTIKGLFLAGFIGISGILVGCGGGGAGGTTTTPTTTPTASITGTAAVGAALTGATVTVRDATGAMVVTKANAVDANGGFTLTVSKPSDYTAPFILMADPTPSGTVGDEHYSILLTLDATNAANNRVNITPITSLILYEATKLNLGVVFGNPSNYSSITASDLDRARNIVFDQLKDDSATLASMTNADFFRASFSADNTGYDKALDELAIVQIQFTANNTPDLKKGDGVTAANADYEATTPLYPVQSVTLNAGSGPFVAGGTRYPVTVEVLDNRSPAQPSKGVKVTFTSSRGKVTNATGTVLTEVVTDTDGRATVYFETPDLVAPTAQFNATSGNVSATPLVLTLSPGLPDETQSEIRFNPGEVILGRTTVVTATIRDAKGNAVSDQAATFRTNSATGGFAVAGGGLATQVQATSSNGQASATYTAGHSEGTETITVSAAGVSFDKPLTTKVDTVGNFALVAASSSIQVGTTTLVTATATNNGQPVIGATVTFISSNGTMAPIAGVKTNASGVATAVLTAGASVGSARVTATVTGGQSRTADVSFTAGPPATVVLSSSLASLLTGDTATITATVLDSGNNRVANEQVAFLLSTNASGSASLTPITATTNANGQASVTYTAGSAAGSDVITARTSNNVSPASGVPIVVSKPPVANISVTAASASQIADGQTLNSITATVTDSRGQPAKNMAINFATDLGTMVNQSGVGTNEATTDDVGLARLYLKSATSVGTANVTARSSNLVQGQTSVSFTPGDTKTLGISAAPTTVAPGGTTLISVAVTDASGNLVANGKQVTLSTNSATGSFTGGQKSVTQNTVSGYVIVQYTAGSATGDEVITARAIGATAVNQTITVSSTSPSVHTVVLDAPSASVPADGASTHTLVATVRDISGNGISGVTVEFGKDSADLTVATLSGTTNASGVATATIKTTKAGAYAARVTASGRTVSQTYTFTSGAASTVGVSAIPNTARPGGTSTIFAYVTDNNGNPVPNETVTFSIPTKASGNPQLSFVTRQTDASGYASVTYTAGAQNGADKVTATASTGAAPVLASQASITVSQDAIVVGNVTVTATRASIRTGEDSFIRAYVTDLAGQPIPNYSVSFSTSLGKFGAAATATGTTGSDGYAQVKLTADATIGVAAISAVAGGYPGSASVSITSGTPDTVTVSFSPTAVKPSGVATVYALVVDASNNPVIGETVTFNFTAQGSGQPALGAATTITNQFGVAQVVYTAGAVSGLDTVKGTASNGKNNVGSITPSSSAIVIGRVELDTGALSLQAGGTATMRARVLDVDDQPVGSGVSVTFSAEAGTVSSPKTTDANGWVQTTYTAPSRIGTAKVIANASGVLDSVDIDIVAGNPDSTKLSLLASASTVSTGGISTLTVVVLDTHNNPVAGQVATFSVSTNASGATLSPVVSSPTSKDGIATINYTAGGVPGKDTISAHLTDGASTSVDITVSGVSVTMLSIGTSRVSVKSDGSDTATITVTALSSGNVVVPNVPISFSADKGQLSNASVLTDVNGRARVTFKANDQDKSNAVATITASASGAEDVGMPIQIVGSTASLTVTTDNLTVGGGDATVTVTARDASGNPVYKASVTLAASVSDIINIVLASGETDANGEFATTVSGNAAGSATLTARVLNATASRNFTVGGVFAITTPAENPASLTVTTGTRLFTVNAPGLSKVRFGTSIGTWSCGASACDVAVGGGGTASATLSSTHVGVADIQVEGLDANNTVQGKATHRVAITGNTPAQVILNASAGNVPPSIGVSKNTVNLVATLLDSSGQAVNDAAVLFSIENPSGGGEYVSPVLALTSNGQASATFTSGSLPTGQSTAALKIRATAVGTLVYDTAQITIGGTAASIAIGRATVTTESTATHYKLPMSLIVADSNGNPVANKVVSLSTWPTNYNKGSWRPYIPSSNSDCRVTRGPDPDPLTDSDGDEIGNNDYVMGGLEFANEDSNENLVRDATEVVVLFAGMLTPPSSSAGTLPSSVVTDANGIANFDLYYLKQYAAWIKTRVRATTNVQGTESSNSIEFILPATISDAMDCLLPNSPFGGL